MPEEERAQCFARFVSTLLPLLARPGYTGAEQGQPLMHSPVAGPAKDALREACRVLCPAQYLAITEHHLNSQHGLEAGHAGSAAQAEVGFSRACPSTHAALALNLGVHPFITCMP